MGFGIECQWKNYTSFRSFFDRAEYLEMRELIPNKYDFTGFMFNVKLLPKTGFWSPDSSRRLNENSLRYYFHENRKLKVVEITGFLPARE